MRNGLFVTLALLCGGNGVARAQPLEVDQAEVLRLGNSVQYIDGGISAAADEELVALGPPASDADKWFISLVTTKGCAPCAQLKATWRSDPWLLALANPEDHKASWAHYNEYLYEDQSQSFRWQDVKIGAFPTVLVQPPRTGRYGDPRTVVFQEVYRGDPQQLAEGITQAIRRYVAKLDAPPVQESGVRQYDGRGIAPPWEPPAKTPFLPLKPDRDPWPLKIPPDEPAAPIRPLQSLVSLVHALVLLVVVVAVCYVGWLLVRRWSLAQTPPVQPTARSARKPRGTTTA